MSDLSQVPRQRSCCLCRGELGQCSHAHRRDDSKAIIVQLSSALNQVEQYQLLDEGGLCSSSPCRSLSDFCQMSIGWCLQFLDKQYLQSLMQWSCRFQEGPVGVCGCHPLRARSGANGNQASGGSGVMDRNLHINFEKAQGFSCSLL